MSTVTICASDSAVEGCPLPAAVVISTDNLPISTALRLTAASKLMMAPVLRNEETKSHPSKAMPMLGAGDYSRPTGLAIAERRATLSHICCRHAAKADNTVNGMHHLRSEPHLA